MRCAYEVQTRTDFLLAPFPARGKLGRMHAMLTMLTLLLNLPPLLPVRKEKVKKILLGGLDFCHDNRSAALLGFELDFVAYLYRV